MIDLKEIVETAIVSATDSEWGYEPADARIHLERIDPEFDWEPLLEELEPKPYVRTGPPTEMEKVLMAMYEPHIKAMFEPSPFLQVLDKQTREVKGGDSFSIPLRIARNGDNPFSGYLDCGCINVQDEQRRCEKHRGL